MTSLHLCRHHDIHTCLNISILTAETDETVVVDAVALFERHTVDKADSGAEDQ